MRWLRSFLRVMIGVIITCGSSFVCAGEDLNTLMSVVGAQVDGKVITLQALHVPIVKEDGFRGQVEVILSFQVKTKAAILRASHVLPRIRDEVFQFLYTFFGTLWMPHTEVDLDLLQKQIGEISKKYLRDDLRACKIVDLKIQEK